MKNLLIALGLVFLMTGCVTLDIKPTSKGGEIALDWDYPVFEFFKSW